MADPTWTEIGDRVFVHRFAAFDLTIGLVVGDGGCLVIDTRESLAAGSELADAVRAVTPAPVTVVNTHAHFDHFLGNAAFVPADIWALDRCRDVIAETGEAQRREFGDEESPVVVPTRAFAAPSRSIDLGGRTVLLHHPGRGHTDNDIVVAVDDVVFAGDLVEQGAPPSFGDSFPLDWPETVDALLRLVEGAVVPGHGQVVDASFVREQRAVLQSVADAARAGATPDDWSRLDLPESFGRTALARARLQLDAPPPA